MFSQSEFKLAYELPEAGVKLFIPNNLTTYHTSRLQHAMLLNMYAGSGVTESALTQHIDKIIELCNGNDVKTVKTDIAAICNALKVRMKYPIDQHCGMRMGIALTFIEYSEKGEIIAETPDKVEAFFLQKKEELAMKYPDLYTFFLSLGISSTEAYRQHLDTLSDMDYFADRMMKIRAMLPPNLSELSAI